MFSLNAPVVIRAKAKEVRNNVAIYSHALPRIHVIGGQRSVRIAHTRGSTTTRSTGRRPPYWTMAEDRSCWWRRPFTSRWHLWKSASTEMEDWKSLVAGPLWWGRE